MAKTTKPWTNGAFSFPAGCDVAAGDIPAAVLSQMQAAGAFDTEPLPVDEPRIVETLVLEPIEGENA